MFTRMLPILTIDKLCQREMLRLTYSSLMGSKICWSNINKPRHKYAATILPMGQIRNVSFSKRYDFCYLLPTLNENGRNSNCWPQKIKILPFINNKIVLRKNKLYNTLQGIVVKKVRFLGVGIVWVVGIYLVSIKGGNPTNVLGRFGFLRKLQAE